MKSNVFVFKSNGGFVFWLIALPVLIVLIPVVLLLGFAWATLKLVGAFKGSELNLKTNEKLTLKDVN